MNPISGGGQSSYTYSANPQAQEIKHAFEVLIEAAEEASVSGGKLSKGRIKQCEKALGAIADDPKMPQNIRDDAQTALKKFENSQDQPNADKILNSIVKTVEEMKANPHSDIYK
jgi:uncharacterized protein (UPF0147 family)